MIKQPENYEMTVEELGIETFIEKINKGQKLFKDISIEDYSFTLTDSIINDVEFQSSFININFKNCSIRRAKFIGCNLKCITFENCDLSETTIAACSLESMEIKKCILKGIVFDTNYLFGNTVSSDECFKIYKEGNITEQMLYSILEEFEKKIHYTNISML